jgi:site-specific DNA-methyltransferase (adenine-specific)
LMDKIFGEENFRNEIIWCYRGAGYPKRDFGRRHDTIFRYSKTDSYIFNLDDVREEYAEATKERFKHYIGNVRNGKDFGVQKLNPGGKQPDDWWQIQPIAPSANERLGYPTQKPEALLEKIIKASSNPTDIILDPMCGCGTAIAVAHKLGRRWIGIDVSPIACKVMVKRMQKLKAKIAESDVVGLPKSVEELEAMVPFEFQNWVIQKLYGRPSKSKVGDFGVDGWLTSGEPVQIKQSKYIGRNVVDNFETAIRRQGKKAGMIVAFSFGKGANEEVARAKLDEGLEIRLKTVKDLLKEI